MTTERETEQTVGAVSGGSVRLGDVEEQDGNGLHAVRCL